MLNDSPLSCVKDLNRLCPLVSRLTHQNVVQISEWAAKSQTEASVIPRETRKQQRKASTAPCLLLLKPWPTQRFPFGILVALCHLAQGGRKPGRPYGVMYVSSLSLSGMGGRSGRGMVALGLYADEAYPCSRFQEENVAPFSLVSGPIEADPENDQNNILINENIWLKFVQWYGTYRT